MLPQDLITTHFRPNPIQKKTLERLGLWTINDLLRYLPSRHEEPQDIRPIKELATGDEVIIYARISHGKTSRAWRKKIPLAEALATDDTGAIKLIWFHQAYMAKKVPDGHWAEIRGKVAERKPARAGKGEIYIANPQISEVPGAQVGKSSLFSQTGSAIVTLSPVYPETRGLSSGWFKYHIEKILQTGVQEKMEDPLPTEMLKKYHLPSLKTALVWIHSPKKITDSEAARKRFAFEEIFFIQLARLRDRATYRANPAYQITTAENAINKFLAGFPFQPTGAQKRAVREISQDLQASQPMTRLLEGDVGSGKTAVAATAAYAVVASGAEVAYMAPTEILAKQHFASFISYFRHLNIQIGLITGSGCFKFPSKIWHDPDASAGVKYTNISRSQLLKWVGNGEIPILVGTHALIQKTVKWKKLALAIIDEQHRFGVMQRSKLVRKQEIVPHLLSMTATPIPRTLALTVYGDLDLTLLDELPAGRKPIITEIVTPEKRSEVYEKIRAELKTGRQVYIICPRIDEPDPKKELALQAKSAKSEQKKLQEKVFPEYAVGLVHSKLKPKDKEEVMRDFTNHAIDILVATSVVEVGVNIPNATVIMIEGAERFGLAQLHQLRGRVFRSSHQAYCFLMTETKSAKSWQRLRALKTAENGFALAELDLALRGAGGLAAGKQWGLSDLGMEAIKNLKMVEAARLEAQILLKTDPDLKRSPLIATRLTKQTTTHFE